MFGSRLTIAPRYDCPVSTSVTINMRGPGCRIAVARFIRYIPHNGMMSAECEAPFPGKTTCEGARTFTPRQSIPGSAGEQAVCVLVSNGTFSNNSSSFVIPLSVELDRVAGCSTADLVCRESASWLAIAAKHRTQTSATGNGVQNRIGMAAMDAERQQCLLRSTHNHATRPSRDNEQSAAVASHTTRHRS
jgi:hypothetical protein